MGTLATIVQDNWEWRKQIGRLAVFELVKQSRGAVLSWLWFFIKPAIYIFCFWFALAVGLRGGNVSAGAPPYILWLSAGIIPWFFMGDMLHTGIDVFHRYAYLVNKIKFPLSSISTLFTTASMLIQLMLMGALFIIYFICGMKLDIYLLQVPLLLLLMFLFWDITSMLFSQFSAVSKDFANLMKALSTPIFWLSGVLFPVNNISIPWIQTILHFNPVTFFTTSFRGAFYDKIWFWSDPHFLMGFIIVFAGSVIALAFVYKRFNKEVADVL